MGWGDWGNWCDVPPTFTCSNSITTDCTWILMDAEWHPPPCSKVKIWWKVYCCSPVSNCGSSNYHGFKHKVTTKIKVTYKDGRVIWKSESHEFSGSLPKEGEDWFDVENTSLIDSIECHVDLFCDCWAFFGSETVSCKL